MERSDVLSAGNQYEAAISDLISQIFSTYMLGTFATCIVLHGNRSSILERLTISSSLPVVTVVLEKLRGTSYDPRLTVAIDLGCHAFVMDQDSMIPFLDSFITSHDFALYRNTNKTVIVIRDPRADKDSDFLNVVRKHPALRELARTLLVDPSGEEVNLWTHRFKSSPLEAEELILLDTYSMVNETFAEGNDLIPSKTLQMDRRTFRLASFRLIPHFIYTPYDGDQWIAKYQNKTVQVDGMGGLVMVEFCQKYNCTWDLSIDQAGEWGMIYDNWTGDGIMGAIAERRADVGVGSLLTWQSAHQFLGFTAAIRKVGISCFAPRSHLIPSWKTIKLVFSGDVWIAILASLLCSIAMFALLSRIRLRPNAKKRTIGWNTVNVLAIFLFQGTEILYGSIPECVLSIALLCFVINLGNIFMGKNASLRAFPLFEPPIDTVEDMANRDVTWVQTHEAWVHSILLTQNPYLIKVADNYKIFTVPELNVLADQGQVAFGVSKLNYGHYMIGTFITSNNVLLYRLMKDDLYFEYEVSMTTKTWPLRDQLSDLILRIVESGIRAYQEPIVAKRYMDYGVQLNIYHSQDREESAPEAMTCEDFLAAFMMLGVGIILSLLFFMGELLMHTYYHPGQSIFTKHKRIVLQ